MYAMPIVWRQHLVVGAHNVEVPAKKDQLARHRLRVLQQVLHALVGLQLHNHTPRLRTYTHLVTGVSVYLCMYVYMEIIPQCFIQSES